MVDFMFFTCPNPNCEAKYAIIRRKAEPDEQPTCEVCGKKFPRTEGGDWLIYQRADPISLGVSGS